jgi:hypothetical protein
MSFFRARSARTAAGVVIAATAALTSTSAAPAAAMSCGPIVPCIIYAVTPPDVTGTVKGLSCNGLFARVGEEGNTYWWTGPITGATYVHPNPDTRDLTVTCTIETAADYSGAERGRVVAVAVPPLRNVVSAAGLLMEFGGKPLDGDPLYICTTVTWRDPYGLPHSHRPDFDANTPGPQCNRLRGAVDI